ncbi:MAG: tripartite tricarboxylate transporter substrate binding protein [Acetobacteraceae bacterium]|nr:tripartite tricarboxylate transporter substrate binding protein [Acetobacteraceae bacterium]
MRLSCAATAAAMALLAAPAAHAQAWPTRPVSMVVPYAPGGGTDIVGREFAAILQEQLGQTVVVENRGGAGGHIGTMAAARARPDGYTFLYAVNSNVVINPHLYRTDGLDFATALIPLAQIATYQYVLVTDPRTGLDTLEKFIAAAKARPGELTFSHSGVGGNNHLAGTLFARAAGIQIEHVSFRGTAPALMDVVAGNVTMNVSSPPPAVPLVREGRVLAIAVTGSARSPAFPTVPTLAERGLGEATVTGWHGVFLPAGSPPEAVERLAQLSRQIAQSQRMHAALAKDGLEPAPDRDRALFTRAYNDELLLWGTRIRTLNIRIE